MVLEVHDLTFRLDRRVLWEGLAFRVDAGSALALRWPSGSGKTTLLRCLAALQRPHVGTIRIGGTDVVTATASARRDLRRDRVGVVTQDHAIVPEWTVRQNLRVVRPTGMRRGELDARIDTALLALGLGGRGADLGARLSGGERQRVAVARVLVQRPSVVLADEPTASLDPRSAARVRAALQELRSAGCAVVVATHDAELAEWCDGEVRLG